MSRCYVSTPASAGLFFPPGTRPVNVTGGAHSPLHQSPCRGTETAMQKPIATLAIGGLINSTLHAQRQSKDAAVMSYTR
jgi:hypothetical protein